MDYEKKYREALEMAREELQKCGSLDCDCAKQMFRLFPELCESEDEMISKKIKKVLNWYRKSFSEKSFQNEEYDEMFAWLEKQGQKPRKVSIWKHWKDGICGNGEGKLIYLIKNGDNYSLSSSLGFECDYIELSDLDNLMLEKQGNPTDEDMKEALRTEYEKGRADTIAQMQEEWSEEDESIALGIEQIVNCASLLNIAPDKLDKVRNWLEFLKERYTWKPSDEQMKALYEETQKSDRIRDVRIVSLYNDLKKLKGE